jgi:hypothetical protein
MDMLYVKCILEKWRIPVNNIDSFYVNIYKIFTFGQWPQEIVLIVIY